MGHGMVSSLSYLTEITPLSHEMRLDKTKKQNYHMQRRTAKHC